MPDLIDPVAATGTLALLVELTVKGALVLGVAAASALLLRRSPAADRHVIWFAALAGIVLLAPVSAILPDWGAVPTPAWMPVVHSELPDPGVDMTPGTARPFEDTPAEGRANGGIALGANRTPVAPDNPDTGTGDAVVMERSRSNPVIEWLGQFIDGIGAVHWSVLVFWVWVTGAGLILLNLILGAMHLLRISGRSTPVRGVQWRNLADEIGDRLFLTRDVLILKGSSTRMPMTWGGLRPVVLLPSDADSWSEERKRCVLTHEFAHIKRWDTTTQGVAQVACAVFWFNPLVWYAAGRLRVEREKACDETVVALGMQPSAYADHLLDLARTVERSALHPLGAVAMAKPTQLEGRVLSILRNRPPGFHAGRTARRMTAILAVALFIPLAALSPSGPDSGAATEGKPGVDVTSPANPERGMPETDATPADPADAASSSDAHLDLVQDAPADTIDAQRERLAAVFIEALEDPDPDIRRNAAQMLGDMEIAGATQALGAVLADDTVEDVRRSAAWAIGEIGSRDGAAYLVVGLDDESPDVRRYVVHALEDLDYSDAVSEILVRFDSETDPDVRASMVWALGEFEDDRAVDLLIGAWDEADDADLKRQIVWALTEIETPRAVSVFREAIRDESADVRSMAVGGLAELKDASALAALSEATRDGSSDVRRRAVWGLGELEDPAALDVLVDALEDSDEEVRSMAVWALGEIGDDRATGALAELLDDSGSKVRTAAIHALSEFETDASRDALISAVKADDRDVRLAAVTALREFEDAETVRALETVLTGDSDPEVRRRAARMLMHIETDAALDALDRALAAGGDVRDAVMQALGRR